MSVNTNVRVALRCRPMSSKEEIRGCENIVSIHGAQIKIRTPGNSQQAQNPEKDFSFDYCYDCDSTQAQIYSDVGEPVIRQALDGFNCTIFAYGQTGSGKSFCMTGSATDRGIIPRLNDDLWSSVADALSDFDAAASLRGQEQPAEVSELKFMITVSFLEIYNEEIKDLLNPSKKVLKIREHKDLGIYVEDLCELIVKDASEVMRLIEQGNTVRRVAATKMNDQSSRSHSCFTIKIEQKTTTELAGGMTREKYVRAKVNLVDLAGSERADKTGAVGSTLKEGANINKSLMALGNVINALSEGSHDGSGGGKSKHIPYRDSKLTRLLQESLGGNARTMMIAAISPADYNFDETVGTLKYAHRAKSIANAVVKNEDQSERVINDLKMEIERLRSQLQAGGGKGEAGGGSAPDPELAQKLQDMEAAQKNAWEERERLSKLLEDERQANLAVAIKDMMAVMKEEKVNHMKAIKRLANEKGNLTKAVKEDKEAYGVLKARIDSNMKRYAVLQKSVDEGIAETDALQFDAAASEMHELISAIEIDRSEFIARRDALKRGKDRLLLLEEEITDERAELVSTGGLLDQNDKIRAQIQAQIQEEEREKAREMIALELASAKRAIEGDRASLEIELTKLREEAAVLNERVRTRERELDDAMVSANAAKGYADSLEERLANAEVDFEAAQQQVHALQEAASAASAAALHELQLELEEERRKNATAEDRSWAMFKSLMDRIGEEQRMGKAKLQESQVVLQQVLQLTLNLALTLTLSPTLTPTTDGAATGSRRRPSPQSGK